MTFSIDWHPKTQDFLRKIPKDIAIRISKKVRSIKEEPFHFLEHYEGENVYKLRIGNYRALIDVDFTKNVLLVVHLEHRKKVYK